MLGAQDAVVQGGGLDGVEPAPEAELAHAIQVGDGLGHPVVTTREVVKGKIVSIGHTVLVTSMPLHGSHVARLAAEVAEGSVLVVSARSGQQGRVARIQDGARLQLGGEAAVVADEGL